MSDLSNASDVNAAIVIGVVTILLVCIGTYVVLRAIVSDRNVR
jgi:hypothetical protein